MNRETLNKAIEIHNKILVRTEFLEVLKKQYVSTEEILHRMQKYKIHKKLPKTRCDITNEKMGNLINVVEKEIKELEKELEEL